MTINRTVGRQAASFGLLLLASAAMVLPGCRTNVAGRKVLAIGGLSKQEEIALGVESTPQMVQEFGGEVSNPALASYVDGVGHKLAAVTEGDNPSLPWKFTLLNSDVINAFALPGGKVFVSRGLAEKMSNEAQLAGVVGHEIGHVTARHTSERFAQSNVAQAIGAGVGIGLGAGGAGEGVQAVAGYAVNLGGSTILLKYSRDQESEADYLGMRYMSRCMYNPLAQRQVMEILAREAGAGSSPEFFATHPAPATRIGRVQKLLDTEFAATQNNPQYQLFEDRFRKEFLAKLSLLPPPPLTEPTSVLAANLQQTRIAIGDPESWCAICAAKRNHPSN
ncbi:MAG TPA: M48 family metallopeptidase [Phycisphaerales bacterium]|nr:M48 family metallopeptidase [Phycisphaerales bacterium]